MSEELEQSGNPENAGKKKEIFGGGYDIITLPKKRIRGLGNMW